MIEETGYKSEQEASPINIDSVGTLAYFSDPDLQNNEYQILVIEAIALYLCRILVTGGVGNYR